ncbi:MAG TPA: anthrone oxygenase family protein [Candidatus Saccharimonadales bacterium]|nr:anthrone oxygenase family protein [Candidatus Saccharimonadales bacterium]
MTNTYFLIGLIIAIVMLALVLGVFSLWARTIMRALKGMDDAAFIKSFQALDKAIVSSVFMVQFFAPVLVLGGLVWYAYSQSMSGAGFVLAGFVLYLAAIVGTMAINVPLNDGLQKVDPAADKESLARARKAFNEPRWMAGNALRTYVTLGAICCLSAALYLQL